MRKVVAGFACSLDGYIEGPAGEIDWILIDKEINFSAQMKRYDTFFYGRRSYESVVKMGGAGAKGQKHYVFSNSLPSVARGFLLLKDAGKEDVWKLKQEPGKDIAVFGGASLLASLLNWKVVDEISMTMIPVILGNGKPMVDLVSDRVWLSLLKTQAYGNGTVQLTYAVTYNRLSMALERARH